MITPNKSIFIDPTLFAEIESRFLLQHRYYQRFSAWFGLTLSYHGLSPRLAYGIIH